MTSSSPEKPSSSPSTTPSDKYLKDFRTMLDKRWQEFDAATFREADSKNILGLGGDTRTLRDNDKNFQAAKAAFDEGKSLLAGIKTDAELKAALSGPGRLTSVIKTLEDYFVKLGAAEKWKEYNRVLASTLADLTSLKAQVTQVAEDKKAAEVAQTQVAALPETSSDVTSGLADELSKTVEWAAPAVTTAVAGIGTAIVGTGLISEKDWKSTLKEGFKSFVDWVSGFFSGDSLLGKLFWGMKDKILGVFHKIGKSLGVISEARADDQIQKPHIEWSFGVSYHAILPFLTRGDGAGLPIAETLGDKEFQTVSLRTLRSMYESGDYSRLDKILITETDPEKRKKTFQHICHHIFDEKKSFIARNLSSAYKSGTQMLQSAHIPEEITLASYFQWASHVLRSIKWVPQMVASGGKDIINKLTVKDGELSGVDEAAGDLDLFQFSSPELRKKYLVAMLWESARHYKVGAKDNNITALLDRSGSDSFFAKLSAPEREEVRAELTRLFGFADRFFQEIQTNTKLNLGMGTDMAQILKSKGFSYLGLLSIYQVMNGKTDYSMMSTIERASMHSIVTGIFGAGADANMSGKLAGAYAQKLMNSADHEEVRNFVKEVATFAGKTAVSGAWAAIKWYAGFTKESPELGLWLVAINAPIFTVHSGLAGIIF
jgi:hypothetical protein